MISFFEGKTYLLILLGCFLLLLSVTLLFCLCNKYLDTRNKRRHNKTTSLKTVDGSVIKYDTLRLVYNTSIENQQNDFAKPSDDADALYVPCDVTDRSGLYDDGDKENADSVVKTISFIQPSPYTQRVGSRAVSECSEGYSEVEDDDPAYATANREQNLSLFRDMGCGKVSMSLFFNRSSSTLRVNVIQWLNDGSVCLRHAVSPYIKVAMIPPDPTTLKRNAGSEEEDESAHALKGTNQKSENVKTFLTKTKGKENPVFDEEFSFGVAKEEDLVGSLLSLSVCDFDKYSRQVVVGCVDIKIEDFLELAEMPEGSGELWFEVEEPEVEAHIERGEILYSLQYLPLKGLIKFTLVKAKNLDVTDDETKVAVKASLLFGRKIAKTHKLDCVGGTGTELRNPEFDETCLFEVPSEMFQRANIRVRVYAYSAMKKRLIGKTPSRMEPGNESCASVLAQWNEMAAQPRAAVLYSHKLL